MRSEGNRKEREREGKRSKRKEEEKKRKKIERRNGVNCKIRIKRDEKQMKGRKEER